MSSVTVIIPAYKAAAFLEETIQSALNQTTPPERVIVVDDGSPDNGHEIAQRLAAADGRILPVQRTNGGLPAARNTGLDHAKTDYVLFLDADDRILPDAIKRHLEAFQAFPNAAMVFGSNYNIDVNGARRSENKVPEENVTREALAMRVTPCSSQCLYRRSALLKVGGANESLRSAEDIDLNLRLISLGEIRSFPEFVMEYRQHPNQMTKNMYRIATGHLQVLKANLGPGSSAPAPGLYRRARRKWLARYGDGQHMVLLGAIRHGRWHEVIPAMKLTLAAAHARLMGAEWRPN